MMWFGEQLLLTEERFRCNGFSCHTFVGAQGRNKGQGDLGLDFRAWKSSQEEWIIGGDVHFMFTCF